MPTGYEIQEIGGDSESATQRSGRPECPTLLDSVLHTVTKCMTRMAGLVSGIRRNKRRCEKRGYFVGYHLVDKSLRQLNLKVKS
jgi:hypothetical protein